MKPDGELFLSGLLPQTSAGGKMTAIAEQLLEAFRRLPKTEQVEVARGIKAELASASEDDIPEAVLAEAERRLEEYRQDRSSAVSHEEARAHLRSLL